MPEVSGDLWAQTPRQEVISLDAYKAAAQENGDFLSCLGLECGPPVPASATIRCQASMPMCHCSCLALYLPCVQHEYKDFVVFS